jgi:hypothetical protein
MRQQDVADWKANPLGRVIPYLIIDFLVINISFLQRRLKYQISIKTISKILLWRIPNYLSPHATSNKRLIGVYETSGIPFNRVHKATVHRDLAIS